MQWQNSSNIIVRQLINDLDSTSYKYSDERINISIIVAAQLVSLELDFANPYTINIEDQTISPDPISDIFFMNLLVMKAACIILGGEVKLESANSISIRDGASSIDMRGVSSSLMILYKDLCDKYTKLVEDYGYNGMSGQAVLGPYSPGSDYISRTHSDNDFRGNYFRY